MTRAVLVPIFGFLLSACAGPRMRVPGPVDHLRGERVREQMASMPAPAATLRMDEPVMPRERPRRSAPSGAEAIARQAARLVGERSLVVEGQSFRRDCSGFVAAVYSAAGRELGGSTEDLYLRAEALGLLHRRKVPQVGDLAFFDDTYDRNRNGRRDDPLSHVAVVESVDERGVVTLVHYGGKGVARMVMDLRRPDVNVDEDGVLRNSILRADGRGKRLTGELFRAWGSLWKAGAGDTTARS